MPGHTRLYRRGAVYYHRAAIPVDIVATYPKTEETFSLRTKDAAEALRRVRIEAVKVDGRLEEHRRLLAKQDAPYIDLLSPDQLNMIKAHYLHHLRDGDDDMREDGFEEFSDTEIGELDDAEKALTSKSHTFFEPQQFDPRPTFYEHRAEQKPERASRQTSPAFVETSIAHAMLATKL